MARGIIERDGVTLTFAEVAEMARKHGVKPTTAWNRIKNRGVPVERAVSEPPRRASWAPAPKDVATGAVRRKTEAITDIIRALQPLDARERAFALRVAASYYEAGANGDGKAH